MPLGQYNFHLDNNPTWTIIPLRQYSHLDNNPTWTILPFGQYSHLDNLYSDNVSLGQSPLGRKWQHPPNSYHLKQSHYLRRGKFLSKLTKLVPGKISKQVNKIQCLVK